MAEVTGLRNNALPYPVYGFPFGVVFPMLDADGDLVTGATTPDAEVSKNGDTFADCTNESVEIATGSGMYYLLLTGTEMTADVVTIIAKSATAGMKTTPITLYPRKLVTVRSGTSASGGVSTNTIVLDASASAIDDFYNGMVVCATIDSNVECRVISDYVGSTQTASVVPDWTVAPDNNDTFVIKLPEGVQVIQANTTHLSGTLQTANDIGADINEILTDTGTTLQGELDGIQADTEDIQSRLPAALVSGRIDASVGAMAANTLTASALAADAVTEIQSGLSTVTTAQVNAEVDTALADIRLDELLAADSDIDGAAPPTVGSVFHELMTKTAGSFTYDQTTDSLEAVRDNMGTPQTGDSFARLGAPAGASVSADIAAIEAQTDDIGVAGAGLTAVPWNAAWDAEVQSEVQDAIEVNHLDHLLAVTYDPASKPGAADALLNELVESDAGVARYTANALEQAPSGGSAPTVGQIADAVWDETLADHLTAGSTGASLNGAGSAGDPWTTALPGAYGAGTAGKIIGDNINATISSRATQTSVDTIDGIVDDILVDTGTTLQAEVDGIQADTEDIQSRLPAALVAGRIDASVGAMAADVVTAAAIAADAIGSSELAATAVTEIQSGLALAVDLATVDTVVDAIKLKTDNLPTDPADESLLEAAIDATEAAILAAIPSAAANATALLDTASGIETSITPRQAIRLILAASAGKLSGAATSTVVIRNVGDTKDRVTATVDADGNRSAVTVDAT